MAFLKRLWSSDYRRALAAEAAGNYLEAARGYALAGERGRVAEMHLLSAEGASGREARVAALLAAARWATESEAELGARVGRALLALVQKGGVVSDGDRGLLRRAAELLSRAGDGRGAGECLELAGDSEGAAEAYQAAGELEKLEEVLDQGDAERHAAERIRAATSRFQGAMRAGRRTEALAHLEECARLSPQGPARAEARTLAARLIEGGTVALREGARATSRGLSVRYAGRFPAELEQDLVFTAAVAGNAKEADAAKAFIDFLKTPAAAAVFKAKGVRPG